MATQEDPKVQYAKMIDEFKKGVTGLLDQSKAGMDELETASNTNFEGMKEAYTKGCREMKAQILKGNQAMIEKFLENYRAVQKNLDEGFNTLKGADMTQFSTNASKFTEAFNATLKTAPAELKGVIQGTEAMSKGLEQKKMEIIRSSQTRLNEASKAIKESAEDTVRKLTIKSEDLTPKGKK